jgi:hypothetical protein
MRLNSCYIVVTQFYRGRYATGVAHHPPQEGVTSLQDQSA